MSLTDYSTGDLLECTFSVGTYIQILFCTCTANAVKLREGGCMGVNTGGERERETDTVNILRLSKFSGPRFAGATRATSNPKILTTEDMVER